MTLIPLKIPCLESLDVFQERCRQMGLSMYYDGNGIRTNANTGLNDVDSDGRHDSVPTGNNVEYEVDAIRDYKFQNDIHWYLVQWKGWSWKFNTWEPIEHLRHCRAKLKEFHENYKKRGYTLIDGKFNRKRQLEVDRQALGLKKSKKQCEAEAFGLARRQVMARLKEWEAEINRVSGEEVPIIVTNEVDLEGPPTDFVYINDYQAGEGIVIADDPLVGCECALSCFGSKSNCCGHQSGGKFAYSRYGRVIVPIGSPIFECNKRCTCDATCVNRVVQKGRKVKLAIFRTANGRGWGVRTLQAIKKGTFVMEYVGEVITNEEAEKRGKVYDAEGRTYLFDLDYIDYDNCAYTVDAAYYGNVSHFMNHSCEPNLVVYVVWVNQLDPRLPRLAFFTTRDIARGEELTFDYMMMMGAQSQSDPASPKVQKHAGDIDTESPRGNSDIHLPKKKKKKAATNTIQKHIKRIRCKCGSKFCRKYLY